MRTRIRKWGNSLGLRLPKALAQQAGVTDRSEVDLTVEGGDLVVRPVRRPSFALSDLVRRIRAKNRHREIDSGRSGRELW